MVSTQLDQTVIPINIICTRRKEPPLLQRGENWCRGSKTQIVGSSPLYDEHGKPALDLFLNLHQSYQIVKPLKPGLSSTILILVQNSTGVLK